MLAQGARKLEPAQKLEPDRAAAEASRAWTCVLCGGTSRRAFPVGSYWIRDCLGCGHRFVEYAAPPDHVDSLYQEHYFKGDPGGYPDYLAGAKVLERQGSWYAALLKTYGTPKRMLDIGAAAGFLLKGFLAAGWSGRGVEPSQVMARHARENLGLDVAASSFEAFETDERFDLVAMIQVLPHFIDPARAVEKAAGLLKDEGLLLVEAWDRTSRMARIFGRRWHEYRPPSVLHWFTPQEVARLGARFGLVEVGVGLPAKRLLGAHAKSILADQLAGMGLGLAKPLLAIIPDELGIRYPGDDVFWIVLRKEAPRAR